MSVVLAARVTTNNLKLFVFLCQDLNQGFPDLQDRRPQALPYTLTRRRITNEDVLWKLRARLLKLLLLIYCCKRVHAMLNKFI